MIFVLEQLCDNHKVKATWIAVKYDVNQNNKNNINYLVDQWSLSSQLNVVTAISVQLYDYSIKIKTSSNTI